jgi:trans-aconitate 2-methyltransferase
MPWNPEIYNQFKNIRYQPFFDLMDLVSNETLSNGVDIGCGTGEQTSLLSKRFEKVTFLGIDSSEEMLAGSNKFVNEKLNFQLTTIEEFIEWGSKWDLVFSNAALQWANDHKELFPKLVSKVNDGGQFAVQMPYQKENILNKLLLDLVSEKPFVDLLGGFRRDSPLLPIDDYAKIMFESGLKELSIFLKVYPIIAKSEMELYDFISGSALIPYLEKLNAQGQVLFKSEFIKRIKKQFPTFPAIYAFKRILLYGIKN